MTDPILQCRIEQSHPFPLAIELNCSAAEIHAVVGPSGSGKTTLLRSIAGLHRAQQAQIQWHNQIWHHSHNAHFVPPHKRLVGSVWQQYALFPHLTLSQNIAIASPLRGDQRRQQIQRFVQSIEGFI